MTLLGGHNWRMLLIKQNNNLVEMTRNINTLAKRLGREIKYFTSESYFKKMSGHRDILISVERQHRLS